MDARGEGLAITDVGRREAWQCLVLDPAGARAAGVSVCACVCACVYVTVCIERARGAAAVAG